MSKDQKDFELSFLFHQNISPPEGKEGAFKKTPDGRYRSTYMEGAFQGYRAGRAAAGGQLRRFDSDRFIAPCVCAQIKEALPDQDVLISEDLIRAVLRVCSGTPA